MQLGTHWTTRYSTDFKLCPFSYTFVWQHIIYFNLEINYFSEKKSKFQCFCNLFFGPALSSVWLVFSLSLMNEHVHKEYNKRVRVMDKAETRLMK